MVATEWAHSAIENQPVANLELEYKVNAQRVSVWISSVALLASAEARLAAKGKLLGHLTTSELEAGLQNILEAPENEGILEMIVRRPGVDRRETLEVGELDVLEGLVGDNWGTRGSNSTVDGSANSEMQLTMMNARVAALVAQARPRWPLAGDQLYIDMDLSCENLAPGTQLQLGSAILEISSSPHTGCKKFVARFGLDAMKFVNSENGKQLRLRGANAKIVQGGIIRVGDLMRKL